MTIVGWTGTQNGITVPQQEWANHMMRGIGMIEFHHGACIGADAFAHMIAVDYFTGSTGYDGIPEKPIVVHPPLDMRKVEMRCLLRDQEIVKVMPRKKFLIRNKDIVNDSRVLLATPDGQEKLRSGTWSTIRYAAKLGLPIKICYPDGTPDYRNEGDEL